MKSHERLMAAMAGRPVDRPPVLMVLGAYGGRLSGVPLPELYQSAALFAEGQRKVHEIVQTDAVIGSFDYSLMAEAFGGVPRFFEDQAPNMRRPGSATVAEALAKPLPIPTETARLPLALASVRELSSEFRGSVPVVASLPGPAALPILLVGVEKWMETVLFDPDGAKALMRHSGEFWVTWANALLDAGADILVATEGLVAQEMTTRDLFVADLLPHVTSCFARAKGPVVLHHTGGRINHVIDALADIPQLAGVLVSPKDDLRVARQRLGPGVPLLGNLDNLMFESSTPEALHAETLRCLEGRGEYGPFVLSSSGADIPVNTPIENLIAVVDAARRLGTPGSSSSSTSSGPKSEGSTSAGPTSAHRTSSGARKQRCVGCGVLKQEIETLRERGELDVDMRYLSSRLHMKPLNLDKALARATQDRSRPTLLVYGDCCPGMLELAEESGIERVDRLNCAQMLLGKRRYRELMRDGAFLLLPEWTPFWKEIVEDELGLSSPVAQEFMQEQCSKLVYLDTGVLPVPHDQLAECSTYLGLDVTIEPVELDELRSVLTEALHRSEEMA